MKNMNEFKKEINQAILWRGLGYVAGCGAIGYAIKVTKSATPLWALLLLTAPSVSSVVSAFSGSDTNTEVTTTEE